MKQLIFLLTSGVMLTVLLYFAYFSKNMLCLSVVRAGAGTGSMQFLGRTGAVSQSNFD
jgi:hypothetical protein